MQGHKINLPFFVSLLDLVMSFAAEIVYGLILSGEAAKGGGGGRGETQLGGVKH